MSVATLIEKLVGRRKSAQVETLKSYDELVVQLANGGPEPKLDVLEQILATAGKTPEQFSADVAEAETGIEKQADLAKKAEAEADLMAAQAELQAAAVERANVIEAANRTHAAIVQACKERIQQAGVAINRANDAQVWLLEHSKHRSEITRLSQQAQAIAEPLYGDRLADGLLEERRRLQQQLAALDRSVRTAHPRELPGLEAERELLADKLKQVDGEIVATEAQVNRLQDHIQTLEQKALSA